VRYEGKLSRSTRRPALGFQGTMFSVAYGFMLYGMSLRHCVSISWQGGRMDGVRGLETHHGQCVLGRVFEGELSALFKSIRLSY
jgi:hypothetical protein